MSFMKDAGLAFKNIILIHDKLAKLSDDVKVLFGTCDDLKERLARLEGKFELLEHLGAARTKRLPTQG